MKIIGNQKHFSFSKFLVLAVFSAVCLIGFSETNAQTKRRTKTSIPQPVGTPVSSSTLTIPEIVRRADEPNAETPVYTSEQTQTTEETENVDSLKEKINQLNEKIKTLETQDKPQAETREKKLLLSLDILSRAEQRSESLNKQLFEVIEKENAVKARIEQLTFDMRPEMVDRNVAFSGSLRPEDVREARQKSLQSEKSNLQSLLTQIQANRAKLELAVERADQLVERIRFKFEKEIDDALLEEEKPL